MVEQMNGRVLQHELKNQGLEIKKIDQSIMLHQIFKNKYYSPYQLSKHYLIIA